MNVWSSSFEFLLGRSLDRLIARSLDRSVARTVVRLLDRSIARSLARSHARSLDRSLDRSLACSIACSIARSLARSLDRSIARSLDRSLVRRSVAHHVFKEAHPSRDHGTVGQNVICPRVELTPHRRSCDYRALCNYSCSLAPSGAVPTRQTRCCSSVAAARP